MKLAAAALVALLTVGVIDMAPPALSWEKWPLLPWPPD